MGMTPGLDPTSTNEITQDIMDHEETPKRLYSGSKPMLQLNKQKSFPAGLHQSNFDTFTDKDKNEESVLQAMSTPLFDQLGELGHRNQESASHESKSISPQRRASLLV